MVTAMDDTVLQNKVIDNCNAIAGLRERIDSAHKRLTENDRITEGIYKVAASVEVLASQVKTLAERIDQSVVRLEGGLKSQGERIGALEKVNQSVLRLTDDLEAQEVRINTLEKEPAAKWKNMVAQVTGIIIAAVMGLLVAKVL